MKDYLMTLEKTDEFGKKYIEYFYYKIDREITENFVYVADDGTRIYENEILMEKFFARQIKKLVTDENSDWYSKNTFTYKGKTYQIYYVCDIGSEDWRDPRQYLFQVRAA